MSESVVGDPEVAEARHTGSAAASRANGPQYDATQIVVIVNARSGLGHSAEWAETLADRFNQSGVKAEVVLASDGAEIIACAQAALARRTRPAAIVAGGGDGTINAVASLLAGTDVALGVLPLGTLNHFARDLSIPTDLDAAVASIIQGDYARIDLGEVNGRIFINNSSLGIYPDIVRHRDKQQRRLGRGKWLAFARATLAALRHYSLLHVRMQLDNDEVDMRDHRTPFVFIGNNEYLMEGFNIGARSRLDAGHLSIYVAQRTGRLGLFRLALRALFGHLHQAKDFHALRTTELVVQTRRRRLRVATDGEVTIMETPLHYRIRPAALRVIVPRKEGSTADAATDRRVPAEAT